MSGSIELPSDVLRYGLVQFQRHHVRVKVHKVAAEMALSVLAYNLTRVMNIRYQVADGCDRTLKPNLVLASHRLPWEGRFYTAKTLSGRRAK
jgi:hypothetical protein